MSPQARAFLESQGAFDASAVPLERPKAIAPSSSSPPAPPKRSRADDGYQRDLRWLERRRAELGAREGAPRDFTVIPRDVWTLASSCMGSQRACWLELSKTRNRAAIGALRAAAFGGRRTWRSAYAHRVYVLGLVLCALYRPSRRKGKFRHVIEGIPREALCALLRDPRTGHVPSLSALRGVHRPDGSLDNGQIGYLDALELAGFLTRVQRQKPSAAHPDITPSCNQYWIVGHSAYLSAAGLVESLALIADADSIERPFSRGPP